MPENQEPRPFNEVLKEIRKGDLHDELSDKLATVAEAVSRTGKAGKLAITLTVKPGPARGTILIADDLKEAIPQDKDSALFFARDGYVSLRHPDQPPLFDDGEERPRPRAVRPANVDEHGEIKDAGAGA